MVNTWLFHVCIFSCIDLSFLVKCAVKIYVIVQIYYIVDFILVGPWFFSGKGVFHVNPYVVYFSVLIDIFPRLILGFFATSGSRVGGPVAIQMSMMKFDVEKFDGIINFSLWLVQVKDLLIQSRLHKALKGKPTTASSEDFARFEASKSTVSDEDWEELDLKSANTIRLCLANNILANVFELSTTKGLREKLEQMYQAKSLSNRLYLKEQFHTLRMEEGTRISYHMSIFNGIISDLEAIGVMISNEDKALCLIL